jgi:quercetin dioxygenase-like cupin family protein
MAMYHRENGQEAFLVLAGSCVLIVEDEERPLKRGTSSIVLPGPST